MSIGRQLCTKNSRTTVLKDQKLRDETSITFELVISKMTYKKQRNNNFKRAEIMKQNKYNFLARLLASQRGGRRVHLPRALVFVGAPKSRLNNIFDDMTCCEDI